MSNAVAKAWVTAPRYMHIGTALRKYALDGGFEIKIDVDKGWFEETIFWEAHGTEEQLERFKYAWNNFMKDLL